ncbi:MAG: right-handed parallel beta-helix repeat-containing protein, partial [Prevotellaceae bacterium]|nr:right-handed parallel beta-helix repeat-containing protein [Prevotellaceae bacterium]
MNRYLTLLAALLLWGTTAPAAEIWVSPQGSDTASGQPGKPVATLRMALHKAREMRRLHSVGKGAAADVAGGIRIVVGGGTYRLDEPLFIRPEDSGTEDSPTIVEAAAGAAPVLSGGAAVEGWRRASRLPRLPKAAQGKVWEADAPTDGGRPMDFRQLWVNGKKATRARSVNDLDLMPHILRVSKPTEQLWVPASALGALDSPANAELVIHQMWEIAVLRIKSITPRGDSACLTFHQPESRLQFLHPWPPAVIQHDSLGGNSTFFLAGAVEFLDSPGEWHYDAPRGKLYYYPRAGEDMATAEVVAPRLETLLRVEGTLDRPVRHVHLCGLAFEHSTWLRPAQRGHVPLQAGMYLIDAYKLRPPGTPAKPSLENQAWVGRMPGGVTVKNAHHTRFVRCR